jgi:hypothetical protein
MFTNKSGVYLTILAALSLAIGSVSSRVLATTTYHYCNSTGGCNYGCTPTYSDPPTDHHIDGYYEIVGQSGTSGCTSTTQPAPTCDPGDGTVCGTTYSFPASGGCPNQAKASGSGPDTSGGCTGSGS